MKVHIIEYLKFLNSHRQNGFEKNPRRRLQKSNVDLQIQNDGGDQERGEEFRLRCRLRTSGELQRRPDQDSDAHRQVHLRNPRSKGWLTSFVCFLTALLKCRARLIELG